MVKRGQPCRWCLQLTVQLEPSSERVNRSLHVLHEQSYWE